MTHPRTPTIFDPPCMTIVNRSVDPVATLHYTIPYEDLKPDYDPEDMATWHEVEDGRTHQFFAFCRDHSPQDPMPIWISNADLDVAAAADLIDPEKVGEQEIFETNTPWDQCWHRITADDERRLITFEEAAKPVLWDTSGLAVGNYVVEGYTWEPHINIWSFRAGAIKVVDSDDLAASPPAVAVELNQDFTDPDEPVPFEICHSTTDGSTLTAYWSFTDFNKQEWIPFVEDEPVVGESSTIEFLPPPETLGESVMVRVTITDPMDRETTAHAKYIVFVLNGGETGETDGETDGDTDGCSFIAGPECESTGSDSGSSGSSGSSGASGSSGSVTQGSSSSGDPTSATATTGEDTPPGSCACRLDDPRPAAAFALLALVILCGRGRSRR